MKGQQPAVDKNLPGVQARCAVFYFQADLFCERTRPRKNTIFPLGVQ